MTGIKKQFELGLNTGTKKPSYFLLLLSFLDEESLHRELIQILKTKPTPRKCKYKSYEMKLYFLNM